MNKKKQGDDESTFINEDDPYTIKHRKRTSKKQLEVLEKTFEMSIRPDAKLRKKLGEQLGMTPRAVQIWFQNRRAKVKKITGKLPKKKSKDYEEDIEGNLVEGSLMEGNGVVEVFDTNGMYSKYQYNNSEYGFINNGENDQVYNEQVYNDQVYNDQVYNEYITCNKPICSDYPNQYTDKYNDQFNNYLIKNRPYPNEIYSNENRPPLYYEDVPPYPPTYPPTYPSSDFVYSPEYYHKHHDEYYHNVYLDENKEGSNVGYPPQYVDMKYYKDYFYKHNYPEPEDKEKK
nr:unnamed protein product [Papilio xuthus]